MAGKWIVFGGWSLPATMLLPLFGSESIYIDVNDHFLALAQKEKLIERWPAILHDAVKEIAAGPGACIAGWSTGAFFAYSMAGLLHPRRLALLSASLSFCTRGEFHFGQECSALKIMRRQLRRNKTAVLKDFQKKCGLPEFCKESENYSTEALNAGLVFLEEVDVSLLSKPLCPTTIFHGREDAIIPYQAGEVLSKELGEQITIFPGGHAFFMDTNVQKTVINILDCSCRVTPKIE